MKELNYLDITKTGQGHIKVPSATGIHPDMGVGTAQQIQTNIHESDSTPYIFRPTPFNSTRESGDIVGASVAWNQLVSVPSANKSKTANGVTITDNRDGTYTFSTEAGGATADTSVVPTTVPVIASHKYFFGCTPTSGSSSTFYSYLIATTIGVNAQDMGGGTFFSPTANGNTTLVALVKSGTVITTPITFKPICIDLTLALGSTIADYIYTLESGTAGAGIAKLREWGFFTKPYYAYNAGGIESVNVSKHIMRDGDDNIIGEYPLDSSLTLRGVYKLDGSNNLYADGDTYEADGTVTRKYGVVDLGGYTYTYAQVDGHSRFTASTINGLVAPSANVVCSKYARTDIHDAVFIADKMVVTSGTQGTARVWFWDDDYTTAADFKAAMSGVMLVYELATPTTETADPYNEVQVCSPYGTEEFVDAGVAAGTRDVSIPVGHNTEYMKNIVGAIEGIPLPPTQNGNWRLRCTVASGVPTYSWVSE